MVDIVALYSFTAHVFLPYLIAILLDPSWRGWESSSWYDRLMIPPVRRVADEQAYEVLSRSRRISGWLAEISGSSSLPSLLSVQDENSKLVVM